MNIRIALVALMLLSVGCDARGLGLSNPDFLVIGHRGAPNVVAENTMGSFEVATALGANALEIDVCMTSDGELVIWHDRNPDDVIALARQAGAEGLAFIPRVPPLGSQWRKPVPELTLAQLREHYGYGPLIGPVDETAVIPTFAELLSWLRTEPRIRAVYVDIKMIPKESNSALSILTMLTELATDDASLDHVTFYLLSVHEEIVSALHTAHSAQPVETLRVVWDFEGSGALEGTLAAGLRDISTGLTPTHTWSDFKREIAEAVDAREAGDVDSVIVWTFDQKKQLAELLYYSVDGVMTNNPAVLRRIWIDSLE